MKLPEFVILVLAFQALLISIFFVFRKSNTRYANILLALFLLVSASLMIITALFWSRLLFAPPYIHLLYTHYAPLALFAPLFYFYLRKITIGKSISIKRDFFHFLPMAFALVATMPFHILSASEKMDLLLAGEARNYIGLLFRGYDLILVIFMIVYATVIISSFWKIYRGNRDLKIWIRAIILSFLGCVASFAIYYSLYYAGILTQDQDYVVIFLLSIFVLIISYFAFNYAAVFNGIPIEEVLPFIKYKKTGLTTAYSSELKQKLEELMIGQKPYLNSELRLDDLSELLGISRHHASQIINEHFSSNFFDFINTYRVKESIKLLETKRKEINLAEVSYLAGFNNTVSFNRAFKKNTTLTPSQYRKRLMEGVENAN